jgi:hypothetical protein
MTRLTTTTATPLAVSADYADALLVARRAKKLLFLLLMLGLLAQIAIFLCAKFNVLKIGAGDTATVSVPRAVEVKSSSSSSTTAPTTSETSTSTVTVEKQEKAIEAPGGKNITGPFFAWVTNCIVFLGAIFSIVLAIIVLLIVLTMLVGRLLGVANTTSAFVWAVVLAVIMFPWHLFYAPETSRDAMSSTNSADIRLDDYRWPGATYTWGELKQGVNFTGDQPKIAVLRYARFVGYPFVALVILFMVQAKSGRGVKYALGEAEVHVDVTTTEV